jgi:hypothetical protein
VPDRLAALATQVEAITLRIRTLGLSRAAEDLGKVSSELRRLGVELKRGARDGQDHPQPDDRSRRTT